ncbi:MAG: hypothetical protein HKO91_02800, partial [Desulfobacterales bacterium]|nr:hypothetical protein [Desulfobacterales bacterium]
MFKNIIKTVTVVFLLMLVFAGCEQKQDAGRAEQSTGQPAGKGSAEVTRPTKGTIVAVGDSLT